MSVFGIFLVRIQSECGKIRTRKTQNTDTFTQPLEVFSKKICSFKNFPIFTGQIGKHLCWSLFLIQSMAKFLRALILKNICERLLLKMCFFMKLRKIKSYSWGIFTLHFKKTGFSTSISEKSENVFFYLIIGFPWSLYSQTVFLWCVEK